MIKPNIQAPCPVFGQCGGCRYQDIPYDEELALKENYLSEQFKEADIGVELFEPIVASPKEYHYRHRLDLKLAQSKEQKVSIGFSPQGDGPVIPIDHCPIAEESISAFIPKLGESVQEKLTPKYRQANVVVRTGDDARIYWGGIGKRSLRMPQEDYLWTEIMGRKIYYSMETFFQANLSILPLVMEKLRNLNIWGKDVVFFDLYGGVGLFALGVYDLVKEAVLIEESKASIKLAKYNQEIHDIKTLHVIEGKVEDCLDDSLAQYSENTLVGMVDPPRAGLSEKARNTLSLADEFDRLLYLSCSPDSLVRDLKHFCQNGWCVKSATPFDFFPKTKHLETLVMLARK